MAGIERVAEARGWAGDAPFAVAVARAYGEAREFERAIAWYERAAGDEHAAITLRDLEQLSNYEARSALARARGGVRLAAAERRALDQQVERAARRLEWLMTMPSRAADEAAAGATRARDALPAGATVERLALLASTYKRLAWLRTGEARRKTLEISRDRYREAAELAASRDGVDPWSLTAWVGNAIALSWQGRAIGAALRKDLLLRLNQARNELEGRLHRRRTFWDASCAVDVDLVAALLEGKLDGATLASLTTRYLEVRSLGSPREFDSVREQIAFLAEAAEGGKGGRRWEADARALRGLYERLAPPR
jgi:tetratricopeptide (TPR) repeat protein